MSGFLDGVQYMMDYVTDLLSVTDYPRVDLKSSAAKLEAVVRDKTEDIVHYRDKCHISHITGTVAAANIIPWIDLKDGGEQP